ncbi:MAG: RNA polymerase sigma-70 factor [Bacteroidales bacterium]|nr:RNA polymerase sigma-70 factor [Bacteroidales bacterium]
MAEKDFDILLFNRLKSGSEEALDLLFKKYYSQLCLFVQTYVHDYYLSEDLVTELYTNIWMKRSKIEISYSVKAYLYTSAKNAALTYIRKKKLKTESINEINTIGIASSQTPFEKYDNEHKENNINKILQKIPPRSRQVFVLHRFEGMKYREISEFLGISIKTVENHISKALKILQANKDFVKKLLKTVLLLYYF